MKIGTAAQMHEIDRAAMEAGIPGLCLMQSAGEALAREAGDARSVAVLCGKGSNGGDGFVAARMLASRGVRVAVFAEDSSTGDALVYRRALRACGLEIQPLESLKLSGFALLVDCLLGTGATGAPREEISRAIEAMNASGVPILACDLPSGVEADTGRVLGAAVRADRTVTFVAHKPGLLLHPGAGLAGKITVAGIGLPETLLSGLGREITTADWVRAALPTRTQNRDSNKGTFGKLLVLAGSDDMPGAAVLTTLAALRAGCGLVYVAGPDSLRPTLAALVPEAVFCPRAQLSSLLPRMDALAIGPGLGRAGETISLVEQVLRSTTIPAVVDADGLFGLVKRPNLVLTPHPGEAGQLLGLSSTEIQGDREGSAVKLAQAFDAMALLKGARTLISDGERLFYNREGSPALATAGSGDVLTGVIGALLAGGLTPLDAARAGAWLHARAGELCSTGTLARELAGRIPEALSCVYTDRETES
jgi:ADP-dependent NAD(P)H-hydrate dehydratase / NAD(P)H-hydrate epimerase